MQLTLPQPIEAHLTPEQVHLSLALGLYVSGQLGFGRAAEVAGLSRPHFQDLMARQRIPMDYSLEDLADDTALAQVWADEAQTRSKALAAGKLKTDSAQDAFGFDCPHA